MPSVVADQADLVTHHGRNYLSLLADLHKTLRPKSYLEIGVNTGLSMALARCPSIGIDPYFQMKDVNIFSNAIDKQATLLFQMTSDDFFAKYDAAELLQRRVDLAFLDGMHRCEFLLRDFLNVEKKCSPNSVIVMHDCLPTGFGMTTRTMPQGGTAAAHPNSWWTGDVWRTALLLKRYRRDLSVLAVDAAPTGLVIVTNLNANNQSFAGSYASHVDTMLSWSLEDMGISAFLSEMDLKSTSEFGTEEALTSKFWL